jgi:cytochrome P450
VGLFCSSANFDEEVFENPFEFDVLRNPNPHLGSGGNGAHYCIGANLARTEIELIDQRARRPTARHCQARRTAAAPLGLD